MIAYIIWRKNPLKYGFKVHINKKKKISLLKNRNLPVKYRTSFDPALLGYLRWKSPIKHIKVHFRFKHLKLIDIIGTIGVLFTERIQYNFVIFVIIQKLFKIKKAQFFLKLMLQKSQSFTYKNVKQLDIAYYSYNPVKNICILDTWYNLRWQLRCIVTSKMESYRAN